MTRSRSKQSKKRFAHYMNLSCYGVFCKFLGDFWVCLGGNSFVKFREIRNIEDLMKF